MNTHEERIAAALAGIREKVETAERERDQAQSVLAKARERLDAIKENKLFSALPSWIRGKLDEIFDMEG